MKVPLEYDEAVALSSWLRLKNLDHWHIVQENLGSHDGKMKWGRIAKLKKSGWRRGLPDYLIIIPKERSKYARNLHIWIELKRQRPVLKSGKLGKSPSSISPEQLQTIGILNLHHDTKAEILCGAEEAINYVKQYLE